MAKQLINPIERHVEKAVLGGAIVLMLFFATNYAITSPNRVEMAGEQVTPGNIDSKLKQTALTISQSIRRAAVDEPIPDPLFPDFENELKPFSQGKLLLTLPTATRFAPMVPVVDPPEGGFGGADLVLVMPLAHDPSPRLMHGRSTYQIETVSGVRKISTNWVTLTALFDVKAQIAELRSKYGASRTEVLIAPPELERRMQNLDGTWPEQWESVISMSFPGYEPYPALPSIQLIQDGDTYTASKSTDNNMGIFLRRISDPLTRLDAVRPLLPAIANGDPWILPIFTNRRDVLMQDDYYTHLSEPPSSDPTDRYPDTAEDELTQFQELTPAQAIAKAFKDAELLLESARKNINPNDATLAWNLINQDIVNNPDASGSDKNRGNKLQDKASILEQNLERQLERMKSFTNQGGDEDDAQYNRQPVPFQVVWAHDNEPDSILSGRTYQYRLRPTLFNLLAGLPDKLREPTDATKVLLYGPWTEPMVVTIDEDAVFFVTGDNKRSQNVTMEFFRWFEGEWVKTNRGVKLRVGEEMRDRQLTTVPDILDPTESAKTHVEFSANTTILDIDFSRFYRERKRAGRVGVKFASRRETTSVVFYDADGNLQERYVPTDKANPERKEKKKIVYRASR